MLFRTTELLKATVNYRAKDKDGAPTEPSHMRRPKILQQLGVNVIRAYSVDSTLNHDSCMSALSGAGIYTM